MAHSSDGTWLAVPTDNEVMLFDARTGQFQPIMSGHSGTVYRVAFAPGGKVLASTSFDKTARLHDVASGRHLVTFRAPTELLGLAFHPNGKMVASGTSGVVRIWDATTGKELAVLKGFAGFVRGLAFRPDGKFLACYDDGGVVHLFEVNGWKPGRKFPGSKPGMGDVAFSADGSLLAAGISDTGVRLFDGRTFQSPAGPARAAGMPVSLACWRNREHSAGGSARQPPGFPPCASTPGLRHGQGVGCPDAADPRNLGSASA